MTNGKSLLRRLAAVTVAAGVGVYAPLAFAAPQPEEGIGLPRDVSVEGHRIDWLIHVTLAFVTILFVIMCIWIAWAVLQHRDGGHEAEYDHGNARHQVRFAAILSALIFFVVDGNLWVNATIDVNGVSSSSFPGFWGFDKVDAMPNTVRIEINAHQWAWDARYAGPDGKFNTADDVVVLNDVRVPIGRPVLFQLASADVIHSFYLPNLRIKQDAMPGMINRMWFEAKIPGQYDIACAQHCGTNHYKMKATLTVLENEDFERWTKEASANSAHAFNPEDKDAHWGWDWKVD